jgi:hypothetical protein
MKFQAKWPGRRVLTLYFTKRLGISSLNLPVCPYPSKGVDSHVSIYKEYIYIG